MSQTTSLASAHAERSQRINEKLTREAGPLVCAALQDPDVIEVLLNSDGALWLDRLGQGMAIVGSMPASQAESFMMTVAAAHNTTITRDNPILECELPLDGSRFEALMPPVVSAPVFAIRKRASRVFSLADYAAKGMLRPGYRPQRDSQPDYWDTARDPVEAINGAIRNRANILVVGGTSSGKTTLANAVLGAIAALCPDDRVVAIEDTVELQIPVRNHVALRTSENVSMARLLRATMRLRPDRIGVGEVRGGEAFTLAKAWNSGHPGGFGTIHADSAVEGLDKFGLYIYEAPEARSLSSSAARLPPPSTW